MDEVFYFCDLFTLSGNVSNIWMSLSYNMTNIFFTCVKLCSKNPSVS